MWLFLILVGLAGQLAWALENMYLNTYITYLNFSAPPGENFDYSFDIALTTALSAVVATLTTLLMGTLSDKVGKRKLFIAVGYLLWGLATAAFGLFNVNSKRELLPVALSSSSAALGVLVLDSVMTFFGSTANDAAFNSYVTKNVKPENKGKVEGVLSVLPLVAMLVLFVGFNGLTTDSAKGANDARWDLFFYLLGGIVSLIGLFSFFLVPKEEEQKSEASYGKLLLDGFRPSSVKKNPLLYWIFLIYFLYAVSCQVFFPYLLVYLERTCGIANTGTGLTPFALVMAVSLLVGSVLSVLLGFLSDRFGKNRLIVPTFVLFALGILLMYFIPQVSSEGSTARTAYSMVSGTILILGYVGVPTVVNALLRQYVPEGEEGSYMGVRMVFVVALPMVIGPFLGDGLNRAYGSQVENPSYPGVMITVPSAYGYLLALGILALVVVPLVFYFRAVKRSKPQA